MHQSVVEWNDDGMKDQAAKANFVVRSTTFTRDAWEELKKVHTPTRQETIQATIVVMVMIFVFAIFLGLTDLIVHSVMQRILV